METAGVSRSHWAHPFLAPWAALVWEALSDLEAPVKLHPGAVGYSLVIRVRSFSVFVMYSEWSQVEKMAAEPLETKSCFSYLGRQASGDYSVSGARGGSPWKGDGVQAALLPPSLPGLPLAFVY